MYAFVIVLYNYAGYNQGLTLINIWGIFSAYLYNRPPERILRDSVIETADCKGFYPTFHPKKGLFFIHKN